jgi:hypothetical protein
MLVRLWRFCTIILAALSMGMAFSHALELPAKMAYDASLWTRLQHSLYVAYGTVGAVIEVGSVLAAVVLVFLVRDRRPSFRFTVLGATCLAAALVAWLAFVAPMNAAVATWTNDVIPADWTRVRDQWEYAHTARFLLQLIGLSSLVSSVLAETPAEARAAQPAGRLAQAA